MKAIQKLSKDYIERCREMSSDEIVRFLDEFRLIHGNVSSRPRLISMKVPEHLLTAFKAKARIHNVPYQTQIKRLMAQWLEEDCQQRYGSMGSEVKR